MNKKQLLLANIREQLAIENNCMPDDFLRPENIITAPVCSGKRRHFAEVPFFLKMVTMGGNAVISADVCTHDWLRGFVADKEGHWLFEHPNLREIDTYIHGFGKRMFQTHHMFLPFEDALPTRSSYEICQFERDDLRPFYENAPFPNALGEDFESKRPDMLVFAAMDGGQIIGMAGASADTPLWWQIGIDVSTDYRGQGLAAHLVSRLRQEVERRGCIPYYGTSLSNLASWGTALHCGFRPAWVETETVEW